LRSGGGGGGGGGGGQGGGCNDSNQSADAEAEDGGCHGERRSRGVAVEGVEAWRRCWGIKKFFLVNLQ